MSKFSFYEFFCGGGMVRAGLRESWECVFANDIDKKKAHAYISNWGNKELVVEDIGKITNQQLPGRADLAWASFPCQDLSLAGKGKGLNGERSGTFWSFWKIISLLRKEGRAPKILALENVYGAITSHQGKDFTAITEALSKLNYRVGAAVIDAIHFLPQSRPRLFIVAVDKKLDIPGILQLSYPHNIWHPGSLQKAVAHFNAELKTDWIWWNIPMPKQKSIKLSNLIEVETAEEVWHPQDYTQKLIESMSLVNRRKLEQAERTGKKIYGAAFRRTRNGIVRAEVRFDGVAGCLRTPGGGSSRQFILEINAGITRSRLLSPRESARLMGLPDHYKLPVNKNEAYHLTGDGVVAPVITHLAKFLFEPILNFNYFGESINSDIYVRGTQSTVV